MSWMPLNHRINHLPMILAGPILRRTDPDGVTVWVALKEASKVTLKVYSTHEGKGEILDREILIGNRFTVQIGKYLHVVAVTAKPSKSDRLQPAQIYAYNIEFDNCELLQALISEPDFPNANISYFNHQLPTFAMPPDDLNNLKIVHGSCRKPHGGGKDALTILDDLILDTADRANDRPQQLFLTGDQIYGDDVADALLWALTDAGDTLLGWQEKLPLKEHLIDSDRYLNPSELKPGQRSDLARDYGGFTAMLINKPEKAKSHLFGLGEYYAMYLFVWSPVLWPQELPKPKDVHPNFQPDKLWEKEAFIVQGFGRDLWRVRRSLANVPTYMICDDHDISDDWYLNREWCNRVISKPLGRRTLQNGLLAYAIFQAWGNTPEKFQKEQLGEALLKNAEKWYLSDGKDIVAWDKLAKYLGIPDLNPQTKLPKFEEDEDHLILERNYVDEIQPIAWYYTIRSFKHEVIVLDTRTWRGYAKGDDKTTEPPMLLSHIAFEKQIKQPLQEQENTDSKVTLIVVPTNLVSLRIIDIVQETDLEKGRVFNSDAGDSWNFHEAAFSMLLAEMFKNRDRVIILSGDIHYSAAVRLSYWCNSHFGESSSSSNTPESSHVLAQLTSSAFKNAELSTQIAHTKAKSLFPEQPQYWAGWNKSPHLIEIQIIQEKVRTLDVQLPEKKPLVRQIGYMLGNHQVAWKIAIKDIQSLPDWRYRIEWIKRQKSQEPNWQKKQIFVNYSHSNNLKDIVSLLWRNRWFQEGEEVIGSGNISLVSFQWPENNDNKAVIQDVYWYPAWKPYSVVYSRYFVSLNLDNPPPPPRVIYP
ncbi:MAG TPA: PhoD-like phosphatase [Leptolyngbyaceae cyanobacterium]